MKCLKLHNRFNSLLDLLTYLSSEQTCIDLLVQSRWGDDVICPYCGHHHCHIGYRGRYVCPVCHNKFSAKVGTIFENTKIPLRKWFIAMYLISAHKKGISSCQLSKDIEVTQKTAWYMLHKIRTLFTQEKQVLEGEIEMDEVYIGGKEYFKHKAKKVRGTQGRSIKTKVPIFGMLMRGKKTSYVYATTIHIPDRTTIIPLIREFCKNSSTLYTDESSLYGHLNWYGYKHSVVNHKQGEYVNGETYTNSIEGFWSHFKRMITGIYHRPSKDYLQSYLDESVWRWNNRSSTQVQRFALMLGRSYHKVTYKSI